MVGSKLLFRAGPWSSLVPTLLLALPAAAGSFSFAQENFENRIVHPTGYTGAAAALTITVCIDPTSVNAAAMEIPVQNSIDVWNGLTPQLENLEPANVPFFEFDFESVVTHELGHCIGLGHPNLGARTGLTGAEYEYTVSTDGAASFDFGAGVDATIGSADDSRGDDDNLHYYRISNNDPFTLDSVFDSTSYSRSLGSLPGGDTYAANCDRSVALLAGHSDTECVMQQGIFNGESKRRLGHDDVATIRYAMSGIDSLEGTGDEYTYTLSYAGITASCDIVLDFDDTKTGFGVCQTGATSLDFPVNNYLVITSANIYFNTGTQMGNEFDWFFNPVRLVSQPNHLPSMALPGLAALALGISLVGVRAIRRFSRS